MARHDYDLPPDYHKRIEEGTMSEWYTAERCRRQAMRQDTNFESNWEKLKARIKRKKDRLYGEYIG
jgi:hypothetical protein